MEVEQKRCPLPNCDATLERINVESSWTVEKYFCPSHKRIFVVPTTMGKVAQVTPTALAAVVALKLALTVLGGDDGG